MMVFWAIPAGALAALRSGSWWDRAILTIPRIGVSTTQFWLGLLLIYLFYYRLDWFPQPSGRFPLGALEPTRVTGLLTVNSLLAGDTRGFLEALRFLFLPLARALAPDPRLVFLDEPTAALDMSIKGQIVNLLLELQDERRIAYVLVTHDLRVTRFIADRVLVMYGGQIMEMGPKEAVYREPLHPYTHALMSATRMGRWKIARRADRFVLKGEVVFDDFAAPGCKLRHRCSFATEDCPELQPLLEMSPGRLVRCGRAGEVAS